MSNADFYKMAGYDPFAHDNGQPPTAPAITYADSPTPGPATPVAPGPTNQLTTPNSHPSQQYAPAYQQHQPYYSGPVSPVTPISQHHMQIQVSHGSNVPSQFPPHHQQLNQQPVPQYPPPVHHPPIAELDSTPTPTSTTIELQNLRPAFDDQKETATPYTPSSPATTFSQSQTITFPYQPPNPMTYGAPSIASSVPNPYAPSLTPGYSGSHQPPSVSAVLPSTTVAPSTTTSTPTPNPTKYHGPAGHAKGYKRKAKRAGCFGGTLAIFCCCGAGICQAALEGCSDFVDCCADAMT